MVGLRRGSRHRTQQCVGAVQAGPGAADTEQKGGEFLSLTARNKEGCAWLTVHGTQQLGALPFWVRARVQIG